jgi:hypothetical protein
VFCGIQVLRSVSLFQLVFCGIIPVDVLWHYPSWCSVASQLAFCGIPVGVVSLSQLASCGIVPVDVL